MPPLDIDAIAAEALELLGTGRQIAPFSSRAGDFGVAAAYRVVPVLRRLREDRGQTPIGRKIGFTNRTIWPEYGVYGPIWGYMYDATVFELASVGGGFPLAGLTEPRIEPEIVFGLGKAPAPGMDEAALLECVDWIAHGFEIVQSIFPAWKFSAADTIAAYGLHGAYLIGPRHKIVEPHEHWMTALSGFDIDLFLNGKPVAHGRAADVLDGPLSALRHLNDMLAADPDNPPLAAGEMVTTGTLTAALPVASGQTWSTKLHGIQVDGISVTLR